MKNSDAQLINQRFTSNERRIIVELYDRFDCKVTAMNIIKSISGYEHLYEQKIKGWKGRINPQLSLQKSSEKSISDEFEDEVLAECAKACLSLQYCRARASNFNSYYYSSVKECAIQVLNRDYWDADTSSYVKKWKLNKRIRNLQFTNKWVSGILRRSMTLPCPVNDSVLDGGNNVISSEQLSARVSCGTPISDNSAGDSLAVVSKDTAAAIHESYPLLQEYMPNELNAYDATSKSPDNSYGNLSGRKTLSGRPVSDEFEAAVLGECQLSGVSKKKKSASSNGYSYLSVKMCANIVLNKDYWDADSFSFTKKWKLDRRTSKLKFTNKWVCGFLKRSTLKLESSNGEQPSQSVMPSSNGPDAPISAVPHHNVSSYFDLKEGDLDRIMAFFD